MKKINKLFYITLLVLFISPVKAKNILQMGALDAKITIKVFSSLTCPHCANFHLNIFESLKKDFIDKNLIKFEHHSFPLDLAALNAELIVRCHNDSKKSFQLLSKIYEKQNNWTVGSDINVINESIKKIGLESGLSKNSMKNCLENETLQQQILNERINAQKNYQITSTPTIYINKKRYDGKHDYKKLKKEIEKLL